MAPLPLNKFHSYLKTIYGKYHSKFSKCSWRKIVWEIFLLVAITASAITARCNHNQSSLWNIRILHQAYINAIMVDFGENPTHDFGEVYARNPSIVLYKNLDVTPGVALSEPRGKSLEVMLRHYEMMLCTRAGYRQPKCITILSQILGPIRYCIMICEDFEFLI